jgi:hypothetical protein
MTTLNTLESLTMLLATQVESMIGVDLPLRTALSDILGDPEIDYKTHLSTNGVAKTQHAISSAGHWFDQLKIAEAIIQGHRGIVLENAIQIRKHHRSIKLKNAEVSDLEQQYADCTTHLERVRIQNQIADLKDEIELSSWQGDRMTAMVRDLIIELRTAMEERSRIISDSGIEDSNYEDLQVVEGSEALVVKLARAAAIGMGISSHIPENLMTVLMDTPDHLRPMILSHANQQFSDVVESLKKSGFLLTNEFAESEKALDTGEQ